jgi:hypothetical protein
LWFCNGTAQKSRFLESGNLSDLNDAISTLPDAVRPCPDGHPRRAELLASLGSTVHIRFFQLGDKNDYERAITAFTSATDSQGGPASVRFKIAVMWARLRQFNKCRDSVGLQWDEFERLIRLGPESVEYRQVIGSRVTSWGASVDKLGIPFEGWSE